jgi:hypothetical protein
MPFASFGVADQFRVEGHEIRADLHVVDHALPQGKHGGEVPVARMIRAVVVMAPEQIGNGRVREVRD